MYNRLFCLGKEMRKHEKIIQYFSLATVVVTSALLLSLPLFDSIKTKKLVSMSFFDGRNDEDFYANLNLAQLCHTDVNENQWKYIVIHHSATAKGNAARFDYYHRKERGWEYGLAYHFVIGNGSFSGDGEIEVSERWKKQIHGAHTANMDCNRVAIGICLVGDFENGGAPTDNQFKSLLRLVQYLSRRYTISLSNILLHKQVHQKGTACPGKNFPFEKLKTHLLQIASNSSNRIKEL